MKPTEEQIAKLPKWAQDHLSNLSRERDVAVTALNAWRDGQKESPVFFEDMLCDGQGVGPTSHRVYVQTRDIEIRWLGIQLRVRLNKGSNMHHPGIGLQWEGLHDGGSRIVAMVPSSHQSVDLISRDKLP